MKAEKGGSLMLFVPDSTGTGKRAIAAARSHTLTVNTEVKDTTTKDNGGNWSSGEAGVSSWSADTENVFCLDADNPGAKYDDLLDLMLKREPVEIAFGKVETEADNVPAAGWKPGPAIKKGKALITSLVANAPNGDVATFTAQFTGVGPLEKVTGE